MSAELLNELMERAKALAEEEKLRFAEYLMEKIQVRSSSKQEQPEFPDAVSEVERNSESVREGTTQDWRRDVCLSEEKAAHRSEHMIWLKANRDAYAGQYVALDGSRLVGTGNNVREAEAVARQRGVEKPFIVYLFPLDSIPFGGW